MTIAPVERGGRKPSLWRSIRKPIQDSKFFKNFVASLAANYIRLVRLTNPMAKGSDDPTQGFMRHRNAIFGLWHGQHIFIPVYHPRGNPMATMISRSADAEINALCTEKLGLKVFRGSGGREREKAVEKGGIRGLIALKKALDAGMSVGTVADIPSGTPRDAGMGIITLAKLSGRPIVPVAFNTSRRKVLEKTWDKTTVNLPFGRSAICFGEPIQVPRDADDAAMEASRLALTDAMNVVTDRARKIVDGVA
ncbi:lysophospholipid acyltransferase family protein [Arvimicrobium flavum]|uniref:lysophospholipid acyltransferase family protein n=1 Tax=Arvimicrobium flavum TaxID=3393320 RepID=UPI00237BCDB5|nr:lysophospholipid acyltransferase family protein [Mesorhizobium shangrilense]